MKAAIFSHGRGSFAYTAGRLCSTTPKYDITIGSGNGAILATFAVCSEYNMLHDFILNTKGEKFYNRYVANNKNVIEMIKSIIKNKQIKRSVISTFMPYFRDKLGPMYYKMMTSEKSMYLTIYNSTRRVVEIKEIPGGISSDRFAKFLFASSAHPLIFSNTKIGNSSYRSAVGVEPLPISKFLNMGITELDIYTNLPFGSLDGDPSKSPYFTLQVLDDNARYLQLKELRSFIMQAEQHKINYRMFFLPIGLNDLDPDDINKYFDKGYTSADVLNVYKG